MQTNASLKLLIAKDIGRKILFQLAKKSNWGPINRVSKKCRGGNSIFQKLDNMLGYTSTRTRTRNLVT